jgi:hypothetical protein
MRAVSAVSEPFMTDQVHLVVATPCFGGQVSSIYAGSSVFHGDVSSQFAVPARAAAANAA